MTTPLYHYTCDHGRLALGAVGELVSPLELVGARRVAAYPLWQQSLFGLIWCTDLDAPVRDALGLTSHTIGCDRTEYRYRVTDTSVLNRWTDVRNDFPARLRDGLECVRAVRPAHWWVASVHVPVVYAPVIAADLAVGAS